MFIIPSRASDAGPLSQPEPEPDWRDHLEAAKDAINDAGRLYRDDFELRDKLRREALETALENITDALRKLPATVVLTDADIAAKVIAMGQGGCTLAEVAMVERGGRA
jgi:hypothetical protein